ncbi:MAG: hypothetical protein VYE53_12170, partial [Planctomycetota bacterium]|nr:hypothetical protein [Planctomycetota bacterium]
SVNPIGKQRGVACPELCPFCLIACWKFFAIQSGIFCPNEARRMRYRPIGKWPHLPSSTPDLRRSRAHDAVEVIGLCSN